MNHNEQSGCLGTVSPLNHKSIFLEKKIDALETESGYKGERKWVTGFRKSGMHHSQ